MRTNRNMNHRALSAEQLERRDLLAADWGGAPVLPPEPCQLDGLAVIQGAVESPPTDALQPQERTREEASSGDGVRQRPRDRDSQDASALPDTTLTVSTVETAALQGSGGQLIAASSQLSDEETADLLFIREEEKLARDVYRAMYEKWGAPIFDNIAEAEQRHMDAVLQLIDKHGLADLVGTNGPGVFEDEGLQDLYDRLVSNETDLRVLEGVILDGVTLEGVTLDGGSTSLLAAYRVGAFIEEYDILDIEEAIGRTTHNDIQTVYENLVDGSCNHLRSFVKQIEATGEDYTPVLLPVQRYEEILSGTNGQRTGQRQGQAGLESLQTASELTTVAVDQLYAEYGLRSGR